MGRDEYKQARRGAVALMSTLGTNPPNQTVRYERPDQENEPAPIPSPTRAPTPAPTLAPVPTQGVAQRVAALRKVARYAQQRARSDLFDATLGRQPSSDAYSGLTRDSVPSWIPKDELRDWAASPKFSSADGDACGDGMGGVPDCDAISSASDDDSPSSEHQYTSLDESRWGTSLRNISGLYARARHRTPPAIRGFVLVVAPPTLTERFGLPGLHERRHGHIKSALVGKQTLYQMKWVVLCFARPRPPALGSSPSQPSTAAARRSSRSSRSTQSPPASPRAGATCRPRRTARSRA